MAVTRFVWLVHNARKTLHAAEFDPPPGTRRQASRSGPVQSLGTPLSKHFRSSHGVSPNEN